MDLFSWKRVVEAAKMILPQLDVTLSFVLISVILSTILAFFIAIIRVKRIPILYNISSIYISYMRGVPFLVQLMIVVYGCPMIIKALTGINAIRWNAIIFAITAMVLNEAAYIGENMRGAIESVPKSQMEAGYSIGMTEFQTFTRIIFPQSVKTLIPVYGTTLVDMLMSTSMLYTVGVMDIVFRSQSVASITGHSFEGYFVCVVIYVSGSFIIRKLFDKLNAKMNYGERGEV